ncbi:hypothetical protein QN277_009200 [Acacia crassicarpa]|uniref:Polysaccharide biosynthesis domain-containing protein n=1 Tax=Acacia crassicarpa TaxID=499986 RepID=A0AAE1IUN9_9FABA|nr:hypothetical protein QN277_009200 [Acacia crassicarpa]
MRNKTQFSGSLKIGFLFFSFLLIFIFILRSSFFFPISQPQTHLSNTTISPEASDSEATKSEPPPCLTGTCTKIPPSLANVIIHYATTNVTPQQTINEISVSARVLQKKSPCNFLVFGLGHDSLMWTSLNHGGRTVFLEEDKAWIGKISEIFPLLESYHVVYDTKVRDAEELMKMGMEEEDCQTVTDPRFSKCKLALKGFPSEIYDIDWDVIMVDAPTGYFEGAPGRMSAIYTAGLMARNREEGETDVFVHDVDRVVEDKFSRGFLCEGYLSEQEGRIRHFTIPSHRARMGRPFCPQNN